MQIKNADTKSNKFPTISWTESSGYVVLSIIATLGFMTDGAASSQAWVTFGVVLVYAVVLWGIDFIPTLSIRQALIPTLVVLNLVVLYFGEGGWSVALLFFMLSSIVMYAVPSRQGYIWILIFGLIILVVYLTKWSGSGSLIAALGTFAGFLFFGSNAEAQMKAIQASEESQRLLLELQDAHRQLQERTDQAEELAATNERNHLAREVHDTLGHQLTVAAVQLEGAQKLIRRNPDKAEEMVATVRGQVLDGLHELRRTIATLRAPIEEDLALPQALVRLTHDFEEATNVKMDLVISPDLPDLPGAQRKTIFRAVQEALTNIQKHAQARIVQVYLDYQLDTQLDNQIEDSGYVRLFVRDDGVGLPINGSKLEEFQGFGLRGMAERVNQFGGEMTIRSRETGGTELQILIPSSAVNEAETPKAVQRKSDGASAAVDHGAVNSAAVNNSAVNHAAANHITEGESHA